ncbi:hypothetical protein ACIA5D_51510 [Actinoplanes sp. NPDC051513]|uniref:hypothetical protein n=1 Tax=Actinoplanes sp. NPDC051513 TaxID=3363908 RepID=UPI0037BA20B8
MAIETMVVRIDRGEDPASVVADVLGAVFGGLQASRDRAVRRPPVMPICGLDLSWYRPPSGLDTGVGSRSPPRIAGTNPVDP